MNILALEPYYGGSHRAFLDGWIERSRHNWTLLTHTPNKWKWRMRHSAVTLSKQVKLAMEDGESWDAIFCSDMLNLAEFLGLCPQLANLPTVVYFHENQLTYPVEYAREWDYHFSITNMTSALAASQAWFNSEYNRDSFLSELEIFLKRMPDNQPLDAIGTIRKKSTIVHPCISLPSPNTHHSLLSTHHSPHILWAARWEQDKNPQAFFDAVNALADKGIDFKLSVIGGGNSRNTLPIFDENKEKHKDRIVHWGWMETREDYLAVLQECDIAVSTAIHEFFGISMAEAAAAGAYPLVPDALAYPELLDRDNNPDFFYDNSAPHLIARLEELCTSTAEGKLWNDNPDRGIKTVTRFAWEKNVPAMDDAISAITI